MILTQGDLPGFAAAGRLAASFMEKACKMARPWTTTLAIDRMIGRELMLHGAKSAPKKDYRFPGAACISVNRVAAHGIPSRLPLQSGDTVNIDISLSLRGCYADMGRTVTVGEAEEEDAALCRCAREGLSRAVSLVKPGAPVRALGAAMEACAREQGFDTIVNLAGHGIGNKLHDEPHLIFCHDDGQEARELENGMLIALECFVTTGDRYARSLPDGWGLALPHGQRAAQWEDTLLVTPQGAVIFTDKELDESGIRLAAEAPSQPPVL